MEPWSSYLHDHPIFKLNKAGEDGPLTVESLDVQTSNLQEAKALRDTLPTKRKAMVIRNNEVMVAVGKELRVTAVGFKQAKTYITLRSLDLDFDIYQIALSPSKKLLAIGGINKVVVVVLPRIGNSKPGVDFVECKSLQIGRFLHNSRHAAIAEIGWHPWGEAGASLLVLTSDAKLREYDVSADPAEPVQTISFFSEQKLRSGFSAEDPAAREAVSYSIGQGSGDWSPLTLYAGMRNGDIYAICPFLPVNAIIPSSYLFSLDGFVAAKEESINVVEETSGTDHGRLTALYAQQRRYIASLLNQLPPDVSHTSETSPVYVNSCLAGKRSATRQGPFLLQPAPRLLGQDVDDTTDILYVLAGGLPDATIKGWKRPIGMLLIANQDGRIDVCLDLDKVEAQWDTKARSGLPALVVYETIDLRFVPTVASPSPVPLSYVSHPVLTPDPIHDDIVYVYHALGIHCLDFGTMLDDLGKALSDSTKAYSLENPRGTGVTSLTATSLQNSDPVIAVSLPTDNAVTSPIIALTLRFNIKVLSPGARPGDAPKISHSTAVTSTSTASEGAAYISALSSSPFTIPTALLQSYATLVPIMVSGTPKTEFVLNPGTLRQLSTISDKFRTHVQDVQVAHQSTQSRASLQVQEFARQQQIYSKAATLFAELSETRQVAARKRLDDIQLKHNQLLGRMDRILKKLMLRASPELNEHETRWFNELGRMKQEIIGANTNDQDSLSAKTDMLRGEVDELLQRVKAAKTEEPRRWDLTGKNEVLGTSQATQLGLRSQHGLADIRHLEKLVLDLAAQVDVSLSVSHPPLTASSL